MFIKQIDTVLGKNFAEMYYHILAYQPGWQWGHNSNDNDRAVFWYKHLTPDGDPLTKNLTKKMQVFVKEYLRAEANVLRVYANGQTANLITGLHYDDLEENRYTFLYYPHTLSEQEGGETFFYNKDKSIHLVNKSVADSALLFDSRILHMGRPPTNAFPGLRVTVAYKLEVLPSVST